MLSYTGTIVPAANFNAERSAIKLQKAMKGLGSDEKVIIEVMTSHSNAQRQEIKKKYKALYGRELSDDIKGELGGHFETLCVALLAPHQQYLYDCLRTALTKDDERDIMEILVPVHADDRAAIAQMQTDDKLEVKSEIEVLLKKLLEGAGERKEETAEDVEKIKKSISDGDADAFIGILRSLSLEELRTALQLCVCIDEEAKSLLIAQTQLPYLALVQVVVNECDYFADRLNSCFQGGDSDDVTLIRIITTHSETNLSEIKERFKVLFGRDLSEAITDNTSGDYRKLLLKILG